MHRILSSVLVALALMISFTGHATYVSPDIFTWDSYYSGVRITGFSEELPDNAQIIIPSRLNSLPVVAIKEGVFTGNLAIKTVVLPHTLRFIERDAFKECLNLQMVAFAPYTLYEGGSYPLVIESGAFQNCLSLTQITIPFLADIASNAFGEGLRDIYSLHPTIPPTVANDAFGNDLSEIILHTPSVSSVNTYKKEWKSLLYKIYDDGTEELKIKGFADNAVDAKEDLHFLPEEPEVSADVYEGHWEKGVAATNKALEDGKLEDEVRYAHDMGQQHALTQSAYAAYLAGYEKSWEYFEEIALEAGKSAGYNDRLAYDYNRGSEASWNDHSKAGYTEKWNTAYTKGIGDRVNGSLPTYTTNSLPDVVANLKGCTYDKGVVTIKGFQGAQLHIVKTSGFVISSHNITTNDWSSSIEFLKITAGTYTFRLQEGASRYTSFQIIIK